MVVLASRLYGVDKHFLIDIDVTRTTEFIDKISAVCFTHRVSKVAAKGLLVGDVVAILTAGALSSL